MKSKTVLVTSLAAVTFGLVSLVDTAGALPFSAKTVQADTQTLTTAAKYYILVPKDSEVFKNWRGTANRPIIWATKTTPELSYFQESARNYIANENKSGANYIEWKGTVEEFKEAIKNLTDKKLTPNPAPIPQSDKKPTPDPTPNPQSTVPSGWSGSSYYQNGTKVTSKWIFDKNYNSYFYLDASGNYVQNAWEGDYYLKSGGYMAKKEWIYDKNYGAYYYLTPDGYQVDGSGKWISSEGTHTASSSQATSLGISLYNVNDAMTYIDIALPSTPSSSYQVAYDFALVDANTGSVSTQTQFTVTYNPSLRVFQTRHFFSATPDGSYRFVIKGKGQDGKVYDGQSVVFRVKNHRFVG
ncbi:choline binding domain Cbp6 [Streptococcus pneumoniae]|uniref:hypothetical protein n=1 Tax=Streptococcus pneumoniae TaxID=1313 RepID=UPI0007656525|nr:hypothetical protein [Streptococcus pneumoniae]CVX43307.1 choline binding domain Cbp6 [Streptococcus pneumoniae]CWE71110.1 choline binding domain Cbp6 [Streptococcus pneumoniae]